MKDLKSFLRKKLNEKRIISYSLTFLKEGEEKFSLYDGYAVLKPKKIKAEENTIYDLASLTKPLATSLLMAILLERKLINLEDRLGKFFNSIPLEKREIKVYQLLSHSSGIIAWKPLYYKKRGFESMLKEALNSEMIAPPETRVEYSCLNYIILKGIIEKVSGESYEKLFNELIKEKLNLKYTYFSPTPPKLKEKISATEDGNEYEREKAKNLFNIDIPKRTGIIWGEVHDGNSYYAGGTGGNAGLFSTAKEVGIIARQFLKDYSLLLKSDTIELFYKDFTPFDDIRRSIGLILVNTKNSVIPSLFSKKAGYHNGFTGTSFAVDSKRNLVVVILTNRVHPYVREPLPKDIFKAIYTYIMRNYNV